MKFIPDQITMVFDEREDFLSSIEIPNVSHLNTTCNYIRYQDVHKEIRLRKFSDVKTLFVVFGGIDTVLNYKNDPNCELFCCPSQLKQVQLCSQLSHSLHNMLVTKALALRKQIESDSNHRVIFTPLLPVDLMTIDKDNFVKRLDYCNHESRCYSKEIRCKESQILAVAVKLFNAWSKRDAESLGFPEFHRNRLFFDVSLNSEVHFLPETAANGCSLTEKWQNLKIDCVTSSIKKTFDFISQMKSSNEVSFSFIDFL